MIYCQRKTLEIEGSELFGVPKFNLHHGDRVGLLGVNGAGKSVFLKQLLDKTIPHTANIAFYGQKVGAEFQQLCLNEMIAYAPELFDFESFYKWVDQFHVPTDRKLIELSGGQQRQVLLFYVLAQHADFYFFDEPTNHLDLRMILWLEKELISSERSYLIVSHDRAFLENCVNGYWAIHEKLLRYYPGKWTDYEEIRACQEQTLEQERIKRQVVLAQEERYRERGVTARRKRNQKRLERLREVRATIQDDRASQNTAKLDLQQQKDRSVAPAAQVLIELIHYTPTYFSFNKGPIALPAFSRLLTRRDRIAIVGPNGCGKTTFLKALMDDQDTVRHMRKLRIAVIDQTRSLDPTRTVWSLLTDDYDEVQIEHPLEGVRKMHPVPYAEQFGIEKDHIRTPFGRLSGGQQFKVYLARVMRHWPDILILDEPTNDLDQESLEELADWLSQHQGLVIFVSHDRYFIEQCATETWLWTPKSLLCDVGGLQSARILEVLSLWEKDAVLVAREQPAALSEKKTSKIDAQFLEKVEKSIQDKEQQLEKYNQKIAEHYECSLSDPQALTQLLKKKSELEKEITGLYGQWEQSMS